MMGHDNCILATVDDLVIKTEGILGAHDNKILKKRHWMKRMIYLCTYKISSWTLYNVSIQRWRWQMTKTKIIKWKRKKPKKLLTFLRLCSQNASNLFFSSSIAWIDFVVWRQQVFVKMKYFAKIAHDIHVLCMFGTMEIETRKWKFVNYYLNNVW